MNTPTTQAPAPTQAIARELSTRLGVARQRPGAYVQLRLQLNEQGIEGVEKILDAAGSGQQLPYLVYAGVSHLVGDLKDALQRRLTWENATSADVDDSRPGTRAAVALAEAPLTTWDLLDQLGMPATVECVATLHRDARACGYGQCEDGLWRTAANSDEVRAVVAEDRPTRSAEAFSQLRSGGYSGWALDAPLEAVAFVEGVQQRAADAVAERDKRLSRAVVALRDRGVSLQEIEREIWGRVSELDEQAAEISGH